MRQVAIWDGIGARGGLEDQDQAGDVAVDNESAAAVDGANGGGVSAKATPVWRRIIRQQLGGARHHPRSGEGGSGGGAHPDGHLGLGMGGALSGNGSKPAQPPAAFPKDAQRPSGCPLWLAMMCCTVSWLLSGVAVCDEVVPSSACVLLSQPEHAASGAEARPWLAEPQQTPRAAVAVPESHSALSPQVAARLRCGRARAWSRSDGPAPSAGRGSSP